jgi:hypothetical protein
MSDKPKAGLTGVQLAAILGSVAIVAAAAVVIVVLVLGGGEPEVVYLPAATPGRTHVINEENVRDIMEDIHAKVELGMFMTHMNTVWTFRDSDAPSHDAVMGNSASNNFPFWFTVTLLSTGDIIFTSGLLPLGSQIAEIKLDTDLPAGTHEAYVSIHLVDNDGNPIDASMGINITLIIQN